MEADIGLVDFRAIVHYHGDPCSTPPALGGGIEYPDLIPDGRQVPDDTDLLQRLLIEATMAFYVVQSRASNVVVGSGLAGLSCEHGLDMQCAAGLRVLVPHGRILRVERGVELVRLLRRIARASGKHGKYQNP